MKLQLTVGNPTVKSRKMTFWGAIIILELCNKCAIRSSVTVDVLDNVM